MEAESCMSFNISTRPIRVPIIPQAGPSSPHFSQKLILFLCLASIHVKSVSKMPRTNSGSVPSTTSMMPFFRKSSSIPFAASSNASKPSFLAVFDKSIIFLITCDGSCTSSLNVKVILLIPPMKSGNLLEPNVPEIEPPSVIIIDARSNILINPATPEPLDNTPNTNITTPSNIPAIEAISTFSTYHP